MSINVMLSCHTNAMQSCHLEEFENLLHVWDSGIRPKVFMCLCCPCHIHIGVMKRKYVIYYPNEGSGQTTRMSFRWVQMP